jgi:hypothetical protein
MTMLFPWSNRLERRASSPGRPSLRLEPLEPRHLFSTSGPSTISFGIFSQALPTGALGADAIASGHFITHDNNLDLAVSNRDSNSISILLGNGDGTFRPGQTLNTSPGNRPRGILTGNFHSSINDGIVDLAVLTTGRVAVYLGNGDGTFQTAKSFPTVDTPIAFAAADLNGDHKLDLVMVSNVAGNLTVLLGNGNGTFQKAIKTPLLPSVANNRPTSMVADDFLGNGKIDLAIANANSNLIAILLGNGNGTFQSPILFPAGGASPNAIVSADFNGDHIPDLASANSGSISVYLGNGNGTFRTLPAIAVPNSGLPQAAAGPNSGPLLAADLAGDGIQDLVVADQTSSQVTFLLGCGDGTFAPPQSFLTGATPLALTVGDFNNDHKLDVASVNNSSNNVTVFLEVESAPVTTGSTGTSGISNNVTVSQQPELGSPVTTNPVPVGLGPAQIITGDFAHDGLLDLVTDNRTSGNLSLFLALPGGLFEPPVLIRGFTATPEFVVAGDFQSDGKLDLVTANSDGNLSILIGNGNGTFQAPSTFFGGFGLGGPKDLFVQDLRGDGKIDDLVTTNFDGTMSVFLGNGNGTFAMPTRYALDPSDAASIDRNPTTGMAAADFTGNGILDLVVSEFADHRLVLFLGNGNGTFQAAQQIVLPDFNPGAIIADDFRGDGKMDLMVVDNGTPNTAFRGRLLVLLGNGNGTFEAPETIQLGTNLKSLVAGDFNGDGTADVAVSDIGTNSFSLLLGAGNGSFVLDPTPIPVGTNPLGIVANGADNLVASNFADNTVSEIVLTNTHDATDQGIRIPGLLEVQTLLLNPDLVERALGSEPALASAIAVPNASMIPLLNAVPSLPAPAQNPDLQSLETGSRGGDTPLPTPGAAMGEVPFIANPELYLVAPEAPNPLILAPVPPTSPFPVGVQLQIVFRASRGQSSMPAAKIVPASHEGRSIDGPMLVPPEEAGSMIGIEPRPRRAQPSIPHSLRWQNPADRTMVGVDECSPDQLAAVATTALHNPDAGLIAWLEDPCFDDGLACLFVLMGAVGAGTLEMETVANPFNVPGSPGNGPLRNHVMP